MTVTGIIAEFNPFHNGHKYLLSQAEGVKIVAMSGNFVQRGEPAVVDKWTRAEMALRNGADLVVELPFLVAVQSADYFAQGAVDILERLGVDNLAFGTEENLDYQHFSQIYADNQQKMVDYLQNLPDNLSYPQKTQKMWETFAGVNFTGNTPNHILGLSYAKACAGKSIKLSPIMRQELVITRLRLMSHLLPRQICVSTDKTKLLWINLCRKLTFPRRPQVTWENYFQLLKYQIVTNPDLTGIFQVNEELASRIRSAIRSVATVDELVDKVATKRYTKARIRRILTYILVGAVEKPLPEAVHVLGFTEKGQKHLKTVRKSVDIVARIGAKPWDAVTQQADQVYQLEIHNFKNKLGEKCRLESLNERLHKQT